MCTVTSRPACRTRNWPAPTTTVTRSLISHGTGQACLDFGRAIGADARHDIEQPASCGLPRRDRGVIALLEKNSPPTVLSGGPTLAELDRRQRLPIRRWGAERDRQRLEIAVGMGQT